MDAGFLVPILSLEVLPGDTINCRASIFGRLATPIKPILDNLYLESFFFFTPYRQVWDSWTLFNGEQVTPGDSTDFVVPRLSSGNPTIEGDIFDHFGVPPGTLTDTVTVSALPFRCLNKIFNFWFRDENLMGDLVENKGPGPDSLSDYKMSRRRKRRDYLTSALPWPQKGDPVTIDLAGLAPVGAQSGLVGTPIEMADFGNTSNHYEIVGAVNSTYGAEIGAPTASQQLFADLQSATGFTINDLRESFQIQKLLERDARGGTRYPEILKSHFQVTDPALLVHQRPLFLGGGSAMINVSPVQQTQMTGATPAAGDTPQGNLAGFGTVSANGHGFTSSFTEHGHIIGLVNIRADLTYQQGLERYFSRQTRYDFYWPALSHLGEQSVLNQEIFVSNSTAIDEAVFGYMPRYDEYRFKQSQICGLFRSSATASLDVWHLAQDFSALPTLSSAFIEDLPPIDRVVAVPAEPDMLLDVYFKIRAARSLPLYATPGLIDHF